MALMLFVTLASVSFPVFVIASNCLGLPALSGNSMACCSGHFLWLFAFRNKCIGEKDKITVCLCKVTVLSICFLAVLSDCCISEIVVQ